jgi:hypothetical protein
LFLAKPQHGLMGLVSPSRPWPHLILWGRRPYPHGLFIYPDCESTRLLSIDWTQIPDYTTSFQKRGVFVIVRGAVLMSVLYSPETGSFYSSCAVGRCHDAGDENQSRVRYVVDKVAPDQVFVRTIGFSLFMTISPLLHTHSYITSAIKS